MTIAVVRYLSADLLRSQRFIVPLLTYGVLLAVLFGGNPGPPPAPWAASTLALYPISAWLAITTANTEDPTQRHITIAATGGWLPVAGGVLLTCLLGDLTLVAISVLWPLIPIITVTYPYPAQVLLAGALAHLTSATTGTAIGLLCARPLITRFGWTILTTLIVLLVTAVQPWLPPVGTAVKALTDTSIPIGHLALDTALGLALAGIACTVTIIVSHRR
ncbi:MAG: hypothetical protein ACRDSH_12835 [Pseudonocardiaceae bacterium]